MSSDPKAASETGCHSRQVWSRSVVHAARHWTTRLGLVAAGLGISVLPGTMAAAVPSGVRVLLVEDPDRVERHALAITRPDPDHATRLAVDALVRQATTLRDESRGPS